MKVRIPQGGPGNMQHMLEQAQKMQEEMQAKQAELAEKEYEATVGGGAVTVKVSGGKEVLSVKISPDVIDPDDAETLEDLIVAGVNEALKKAESDSSEAMSKITGGLGLPGMF